MKNLHDAKLEKQDLDMPPMIMLTLTRILPSLPQSIATGIHTNPPDTYNKSPPPYAQTNYIIIIIIIIIIINDLPRYMMYIKKNHERDDVTGRQTEVVIQSPSVEWEDDPLTISITPPSPNQTTPLDDNNILLPEKYSCTDIQESDEVSSPLCRRRSRRMTLSPSATQDMLRHELMQCQETRVSNECTEDLDSDYAVHMVDNGADCQGSDALGDIAGGGEEGSPRDSAMKVECLAAPMNLPMAPDDGMITVDDKPIINDIALPLKLAEGPTAATDTEISGVSCSDNNITNAIELATAAAMQRFQVRMELARWKYLWEVASLHAANVAAARTTTSTTRTEGN